MKKLFIICISLMIALLTVQAFATADLSDIVFEEESSTPAISVSGYPRFETLSDGTLLLFNAGVVRKSTDNGSTWKRVAITQNSATTAVSATGTTHNLNRENWQGFVLDDGTVMVSYRARTKDYVSGEFYTSIRVMTSTDNAETFSNEVIIAEQTTNGFHGFWEPFMIQPDENTVLLFYSDDLNVNKPSSQQNIVYHEYNIKNNTWSDAVVAIDGVSRNSRDGMPVITSLRYGGYAMVIETHDYFNRFYNGMLGSSVFVIGLSLSEDGRTWSEPIPVVAPSNIIAGKRCAAPYITTLPDGRVIISYMEDESYTGTTDVSESALKCVYGAVISDDVLTVDTVLTPTKGGAADGFTTLPDLFDDPESAYMIWNTVYCSGNYVYFAGSAGYNTGAGSSSIRIRRADVSATIDFDLDDNGTTNLFDVLLTFKNFFMGNNYCIDFNNDGKVDVKDLVSIIKTTLG